MSVPLSDIDVKEEILDDEVMPTHTAEYASFLQAANGYDVGLVDNIKTEDSKGQHFEQPVTDILQAILPKLPQTAQSTNSASSDYDCRQCGKKFYVKLALMVHEQSHIAEAINSGSGSTNAILDKSTATIVAESSSRVKSEQNDEQNIREQEHGSIKLGVENNNAHEATPVLLESEHFDRPSTTAGRFACLSCEKRFKLKSILREHTMMHTGERPHECNICGERFLKKVDCRIHIRSHGENPRFCDFCGKRFPKARLLRAHVLLHKGPEPYLCLMCDVRFSTSEIRKQHMEMHNKDDYDNYAAEARGRYSTVVKKGPCKCETCGKIFRLPSLLKQHQISHSGERPFTCEFCNAGFQRAGILKHHLRIHTGERPYACEICDRCFCQSSALTNHIRTHTGERPFVCKFCDKRFGQSGQLCYHIRRHSGSKPYWCVVCRSQFSTKDDMVSHRENAHEMDQTSE